MQYLYPPKPNSDPSDDLPVGTVPTYDIAGNLLFQHSMDVGDRWSLNDATGKPMLGWDVNDVLDAEGQKHAETRLAHTEYDLLHRPLRLWLCLGTAPAAVMERFDYRDTADADPDDARNRNLIGQAVRHDDPSGRMELVRLNFTGKVQHEQRRLARHTTARVIDWQGDDTAREALLETETFTRLTEHDAIGRMTRLINWHRSPDRVAVYQPRYNARGVLEAEDLSIGARLVDGRPSAGRKDLRAIHGITYNAKGQRTRLRHGNGIETHYAYDERSFRLTQLRTTRPATDLLFPGFHSNLSDDRVVQQLHYTYDAAGNIAEIADEAWAPVFFRNQDVEARNLYVYDALYRLIEATGRESASLSGAPAALRDAFVIESFPSDHALRNYRQRYSYDTVGNFITMRHKAADGSWTRHYETATDSNRLRRTWEGADRWEDTTAINKITYDYDRHGSMLNLANVAERDRIRWDWRDMIEGMDLGGGGQAWYAYDSGKQRSRKRIERQGREVEERLYPGGMELSRRNSPSGELVEEIETHHLFVDDQRVLLVDDVISTDNGQFGVGVLLRYQYGNHLGSVALELDETAQIISCEELHPYGTTAYQLVGRGIRATAKRYRYTGIERDEESGLSYHTARYYLPWLGRWGSSDPIGIGDGLNLYLYTRAQPIRCCDTMGTQTIADAVRFARALHAIDPDAFNGGVSIVEGRWIPTPTSLAEHRLFGGFAEQAMANVRASGAITADSEELYTLYRSELNTLLRADVSEGGSMSSLLELAPRGTGTQLRFRTGAFRGQFLEFAHDISRAEIRRFGAAADLAIDMANLAPVGHNFHRAFLHIEQALTRHGELTAESVRDLIRTYAAETRAAASAETSAGSGAAASATGTASAASSRTISALISETGGATSLLGVFGGLAGVALVLLTYNQLQDAESDIERTEILFDVLTPLAVQRVVGWVAGVGAGLTAGVGLGLVMAVSSHATTGSHWCEGYSGGCAALSRYLTEYPGATEEDLTTLHGMLELRARESRTSTP